MGVPTTNETDRDYAVKYWPNAKAGRDSVKNMYGRLKLESEAAEKGKATATAAESSINGAPNGVTETKG